MLIVIEGLDGAGKRTLTVGLQRAFEADGRSVTTLAFPRYGQSITADLASEALHGQHGDLASSVYAMATLFALDRAGAMDQIAALRREHDVVILDRYVASNAAYSAARLHQDASGRGGVVGRRTRIRTVRPAEARSADPARRLGGTGRRSAPSSGPSKRPTAPATPTSATTDCSGAPARCTPNWVLLTGADRGRSSPRTSIRRLWRRHSCPRGIARSGNVATRPCGSRGLSQFGDTMDNMRQRILVVDDDPSLAEMLTIVLRGEGFDTAVIGDGSQALTAVRELRPDLVLLDLMLPGMNGIDVCRVLRADSGVPIVMLTAKTDTVDVVLGLESGADDYVMKPFKPKELVARVRARLRRNEDEPAEMLSIADIDIDVPAHKVTREGEQISLTPLEFDLLVALARKPRQVFTRDVLLEQVWGYRHPADTRLVNVHVQRLRAKVEKDPENPQVVLTVRGVGYKAGPP